MRVREFVDLLDGIRPNGSGWKARCPAHDDREASLSIHEGDDGRILLKCFAACETPDIVDALGLTMADLYPERPESSNGHRPQQPRRIIETYPYFDEAGELLFEVVRFDPKDFRQRRPDGAGSWVWNLQGVRRVLYRLPELLAASPGRWVLATEGEKDADRLLSLGFVATTCPQGAGKWRDEYAETLRGRPVAILPDNDDPGRRHAEQAARSLYGVAAEVRVIDLPGLAAKGDVSDWLDAGGTAEHLKQIVRDAPDWNPDTDEPVSEEPESTIPGVPAWPDPPKAEAYYGLAGEIVRALEPSTEADPVGLLVTLLSVVGNIVGPEPHWEVSGSGHGLRIDPVLTGETANGRKGTTWGTIRQLIDIAAPDWLNGCVKSGLSSGEGLIWAVRDEIRKSEPVKEKGRIVDYQEVVVDPGVDDKRLLVIESEFASVLKVMARDGNTLSTTIRQAWDDGNLRTLTKNSPATATGAHVTIIGHVTRDELLRYLDSTETGNGFANRFMFICVRRSKLLPDGGEVDRVRIAELGDKLTQVIETAKNISLITRDAQASEMWRVVYGKLSEGRPGLSGAVLARSEAYVMRIAAIYAVLDRSRKITAAHLKAALALWQYVEDSTRYIFGDALGDTIADTILQALRQSGEMTRSEIVDLFGRHANRAKIDRGLTKLMAAGKVTRSLDRETGGRPREIWRAA